MGWGGKEVGAYELGAWIGGERELTFKGVRLVDSDQEKKGLMLEDVRIGGLGWQGQREPVLMCVRIGGIG